MRREPITPVDSPTTLSPPKKRQCSILMQRSSTTSRPASRARAAASGVGNAELHPDHLRAQRDRLVHDRRHVLGAAEHVHDLERAPRGGLGQRRDARVPEHLVAAGFTGVMS